MGFRSMVSRYQTASVWVALSAAVLVGCDDPPSDVTVDGGGDAATPTSTVKTTATPTAKTSASTESDTGPTPTDKADTGTPEAGADTGAEPSGTTDTGTPDSGPDVPDAQASASADASSAVVPDGGPVVPDGGPRDGGTHDGGGDAGPACYTNAQADVLEESPCAAELSTCEDGGAADVALGEACEFYYQNYSADSFLAGLAAFGEANPDVCADTLGAFHEAQSTAAAMACPAAIPECETFVGTCSELTLAECNAVVAPLVDDWRALIAAPYPYGMGCYDIGGDPGCGDLFKSCAVAYLF